MCAEISITADRKPGGENDMPHCQHCKILSPDSIGYILDPDFFLCQSCSVICTGTVRLETKTMRWIQISLGDKKASK
ncbi:unnamed protein product [Urochloa humidicola]